MKNIAHFFNCKKKRKHFTPLSPVLQTPLIQYESVAQEEPAIEEQGESKPMNFSKDEQAPSFIIFLDIDGVMFGGSPSKEFSTLSKMYRQDKGYKLILLSIEEDRTLADIDKSILQQAKDKKRPILIKAANNRFYIFGDKAGNGHWDFSLVDPNTAVDLNQLPFKWSKLRRTDRLFNQDLMNVLKQGHAQEKEFYSEYVYHGILNDYSRFKANTHFFNATALANLNLLIQYIENKGMQVGIVLSSNWREFFDVETLKKLFYRLDFSKYLIDKIDDKDRVYIDEHKKCDLSLMQMPKNTKLTSQMEDQAFLNKRPILIKDDNNEFCIYGGLEDWKKMHLNNLSAEEQRLLRQLDFNKPVIKAHEMSDALFEIIKKGHLQYKSFELNRAESIELWLKQHPNYQHFLILDDRDDGLSDLFPLHYIECRMFGEEEYQSSLTIVDTLFNGPLPMTKSILNSLNPICVKTLTDNRRCDQRMPEISMRVLRDTRVDFLENILKDNENSPFKEQKPAFLSYGSKAYDRWMGAPHKITNLILQYDQSSNKEWVEAQKYLIQVMAVTSLIPQCAQLIMDYVLGIGLCAETETSSQPVGPIETKASQALGSDPMLHLRRSLSAAKQPMGSPITVAPHAAFLASARPAQSQELPRLESVLTHQAIPPA